MNPDWVDVFPIEDGHIPDSYVALVEGIPRSQLTSFCGRGERAPFYESNLPKKIYNIYIYIPSPSKGCQLNPKGW